MSIRPQQPSLFLFDAPDSLSVAGRLVLATVWNNEGGAGRGLLVTVSGPAIERELVHLSHAVVGPRGQQQRVELVAGIVDSAPAVFCVLEEWEIGRSCDFDSGQLTEAEMTLVARAMVPVTLEGHSISTGQTELHLAVSAMDAQEGDLAVVALDLR